MNFGLSYVFILSVFALDVAGQNLTTYLLTRYADVYHNVTTQPAFFHEVLNGTVTPEQVAYFFQQVRAAPSRVSKLRLLTGHDLRPRIHIALRQHAQPLDPESGSANIESNTVRHRQSRFDCVWSGRRRWSIDVTAESDCAGYSFAISYAVAWHSSVCELHEECLEP